MSFISKKGTVGLTVPKKNKKGLASVILAPIRLNRIGTVYTNRKYLKSQCFFKKIFKLLKKRLNIEQLFAKILLESR